MESGRPISRISGLAGAIVIGLVAVAASAGLGRHERPRHEEEAAWPVGTPRAIAVKAGAARFVVPSGAIGSRTLVVVSSLSRKPGAYPIRVSARPADRPEVAALADDGPRGHARILPPPVVRAGPVATVHPPEARTFHLPVRDGDPSSPSNYVAVRARLRGFGKTVQVYVDAADLARVDEATVRDVVSTFDERIVPRSRERIGSARDVDGDGRFTVLLSGWLGHLADGKLAVEGFVRGADFEIGQPPPLGNRCDMMYLSASLAAGPHLRTILAHEYTHAVTYCRKAIEAKVGDEEGWLDEAIAHLAEDLHGFSRSNLDYRVATFLAAPEKYRLLVEDYGAADLIRSHGHRGSTYRFLRWCADAFGPDLLGTLVRSEGRGVANLEAATGLTFAALYRGWSVGLFLDAMGGGPGDPPPPHASRLTPGGEDDEATLDGTTSHFLIVDGSARGAVSIAASGPPEVEIQVTAVRLPEDYPRLDLEARIEPDGAGDPMLRVRIRDRDGSTATLDSLRWSPAVPPSDAEERIARSGSLDGESLRLAFGGEAISGRERLSSRPIPLGPSARPGALIVTLLATDSRGRRVVARSECRVGRVED